MNPVRRCAPLWASIAGAVALLCWAPALALGADRTDADARVSSVTQGSADARRPAATHDASRPDCDSDTHGRRPFTQPPGHQRRPAREIAPGHNRFDARPPLPDCSPAEPSGDVLGATPPTALAPSVTMPGSDAARMVEQPSRVLLPVRARGDVRRLLSSAVTSGPPDPVALGGALGVAAAFSPAYGDLVTPAPENRWRTALLVVVLCGQVLAAALLLSAVREMLGGFGASRMR